MNIGFVPVDLGTGKCFDVCILFFWPMEFGAAACFCNILGSNIAQHCYVSSQLTCEGYIGVGTESHIALWNSCIVGRQRNFQRRFCNASLYIRNSIAHVGELGLYFWLCRVNLDKSICLFVALCIL